MILKIKRGVALRFLIGNSRGELLHPYFVINVTGFVEPTEPGLGKILVTSCLHLPLRITCCRVSP